MALVNQKRKSKGGNLSCLSKSPDIILNTDLFVLEKKPVIQNIQLRYQYNKT